MKSIIVALLLSLFCVLPVSAASMDELTPFLSAQYYTWEEFSGGRRLLKETGALYSGGVDLGFAFPTSSTSALALRAKAELFGGIVDYDGETQGTNPVPVKTDVNYLGARQQVDLGYRVSGEGWNVEPFAGLGYRYWLRDLQDSSTFVGQRVSGYTESWDTAYFRLAARGRFRNDNGLALLLEAGGKYPFYTGNSVEFVNFGTVTFRPQGRWSGFAEAGLTYQRVRVAFSYEGFRYGASPVVPVGAQRFLQPESTSDIFGLSLGWAFH